MAAIIHNITKRDRYQLPLLLLYNTVITRQHSELLFLIRSVVLTATSSKQNIYAYMNTSRFYFFNSNIQRAHKRTVSSPTKGVKSISIFTRSALFKAERTPWQIPSKSWQLPGCKQKEGSFYLRHVLFSLWSGGPPGLKVTLYHWEKSLRRGGETNLHSPVPIPPALQLTSLLVLWWAEHMHVVTPGEPFSQTSSLCTIGCSAHL